MGLQHSPAIPVPAAHASGTPTRLSGSWGRRLQLLAPAVFTAPEMEASALTCCRGEGVGNKTGSRFLLFIHLKYLLLPPSHVHVFPNHNDLRPTEDSKTVGWDCWLGQAMWGAQQQ